MAPPWELRRRGLRDSLRHDQRVKEAIRKNLRELISEEAIITSDGQKRIRIPLRYLEQYRFKYGQPQQGVGQGQGKVGDALGNAGQQGVGDGMPGDQPGELIYEVEVPLDDLTRMMAQDLALPWLEEKPERQETTVTHEYTDLRRKGPMARWAKKSTLMNTIRRHAARHEPRKATGIHEDDMRFRTWNAHEEDHTNAAVYMLMDRSGSMTTEKKYIAKSFFFWMVRFLRLKYHKVETIFIAHDVEAQIVQEQDFFVLSNSGGTKCSSAYKLALEHLTEHYPTSQWNIYTFHFSDGDNLPYDNAICKSLVRDLLVPCAMVGYGEIRYHDDHSFYNWAGGQPATTTSLHGALREIVHPHLLSVAITHKEQLYQTLQTFLKPSVV